MSLRDLIKELGKNAFAALGIEVGTIKSYPDEFRLLRLFLEYRKIPCVIDVGANEGQFAAHLFAAGYSGTIISVEPMPNEHGRLAARAAANPRWQVAPPLALSDRQGTADFHVSANSISSSLLPMEDLHLEAAPRSAPVGTIRVKLERLDTVLPSLVPSGDILLKIDTQGSEQDVIEGASGVMDRIVGIKTELSFVPLYKGQPLFQEMYELITGKGFKLADLTPGLRRKWRDQDLLQCDGLFLRPRQEDSPSPPN